MSARRIFKSCTMRLWIEITCNPEITTWEHDVYPQTARVFPVGTISWRSSLNPHARNQRSVQSRCCYVRFSNDTRNSICSLFRKKYCEIFARLKRTSWIFPMVATHKVDIGHLMLLRQEIARSITADNTNLSFVWNWWIEACPAFGPSIRRHAKLLYCV